MVSRFSDIKYAPKTPYLIMSNFIKDESENKLNLMFTQMLIDTNKKENCFTIATRRILMDDTLNKKMVPTLGLPAFNEVITNMILGNYNPAVFERRAFSVQTIGGAGSIRLAAEIYKSYYKCNTIYLAKDICYMYPATYAYLKYNINYLPMATEDCATFDYYNYIDALKEAKENSVIILHAVASDPYSLPISHEQWKMIAKIIKKRKLRPFIDCTFIGFESGDMDVDAWVPRYFVSIGIEITCNYSFSKVFGIYAQRNGALTVVLNDDKLVPEMKNEFSMCIRGMYTTPPCLGARVIMYIFNNDILMDELKGYIKRECERLISMRRKVREYLEKLDTPGDFTCITKQKGSFIYYKFSELQMEFLKKRYHIYMHPNSLDLCGFNDNNYKYICTCIHDSICDNTFKMKRLTFVEP